MITDHLFQACLKLPYMSAEQKKFSRSLRFQTPQGHGTMLFFPLFTGVTLAYTFSCAPAWPMPELTGRPPHVLIISYCINGRCKITRQGRDPVQINSGELALLRHFSEKEYSYPKNVYEGLELLVDLDAPEKDFSFLREQFAVDFHRLADLYCPGEATYIAPCMAEMKRLMKKLWELYGAELPFALNQMKIYTLAVLSLLLNVSGTVARKNTFLTEGQSAIACQTEQILLSDLSRHHTARELAEQFSVSESSLKNYFKAVYGQNFSVYLRDARMHRGADLLTRTQSPVSEIAELVGYASQSKFADAFKKYYGISPLEYRRRNHSAGGKDPV